MNSVARSMADYLCSRNNDIAGYWGIGKLCLVAKRERRRKFSFCIRPGTIMQIYGYEISNSKIVTEKLLRHNLDSIEGRLSFFEDGRYADGTERYTCGIAISVTQGGRTGLSLSHVECWPHDPSRESRRAGYESEGIIQRIKNLIQGA